MSDLPKYEGIKTQWVKNTAEQIITQLVQEHTAAEWERAREVIAKLKDEGILPPRPFKLGRHQIEELVPNNDTAGKPIPADHSFFVLEDGAGQLKLGIVSRGKEYTNVAGKKMREGILGHGSSGEVKVVVWEDGSAHAIKIQPGQDVETTETAILYSLGELKTALVRTAAERARSNGKVEANTAWIGGLTIPDKHYTVMELLGGVRGKNLEQVSDEEWHAAILASNSTLAADIQLVEKQIETEKIKESPTLTTLEDLSNQLARLQTEKTQLEKKLRTTIAEKNFSRNLAISLELARRIAAEHAKRILHCDLKPSNIVVQSTDPVILRLADRGSAVQLPAGKDAITIKTVALTSPKYAAPEVMAWDADLAIPTNTQSTLSYKSEVYSLGVLLEQDLMLTESGANKRLKLFIHSMQDPDPKMRPSMQEVMFVLDNALQEQKLMEQLKEAVLVRVNTDPEHAEEVNSITSNLAIIQEWDAWLNRKMQPSTKSDILKYCLQQLQNIPTNTKVSAENMRGNILKTNAVLTMANFMLANKCSAYTISALYEQRKKEFGADSAEIAKKEKIQIKILQKLLDAILENTTLNVTQKYSLIRHVFRTLLDDKNTSKALLSVINNDLSIYLFDDEAIKPKDLAQKNQDDKNFKQALEKNGALKLLLQDKSIAVEIKKFQKPPSQNLFARAAALRAKSPGVAKIEGAAAPLLHSGGTKPATAAEVKYNALQQYIVALEVKIKTLRDKSAKDKFFADVKSVKSEMSDGKFAKYLSKFKGKSAAADLLANIKNMQARVETLGKLLDRRIRIENSNKPRAWR